MDIGPLIVAMTLSWVVMALCCSGMLYLLTTRNVLETEGTSRLTETAPGRMAEGTEARAFQEFNRLTFSV